MRRGKLSRSFSLRLIFLGCFICIAIYLFLCSISIKNFHLQSRRSKQFNVKYIFDLAYWRDLMLKDGTFGFGNQVSWCTAPSELRVISDVICQMYHRNQCDRLPCSLIDSSLSQLQDVKCTEDGRVWQENSADSSSSQSYFLCRRGFALDLFSNRSSNFSYPSIMTHALIPFSDHLFIDILNNRFRSFDSVWGLSFNFESVSNYPWAADRKKLGFFNVTFGYDRQLYDFIPHPWLYNYVHHLTLNSNRLSIEEVVNRKKSIRSAGTSDLYWPNIMTNNVSTNATFVTAPVLWMNSNCNTRSKRTEYMQELMQYIDVDNYGNCGQKILSLPKHIVDIQDSSNRVLTDRGSYKWEAGKIALSNDYLFTIAIENSIDHDYITEKLWHPFVAGSVPVYLGAPNIEDWLPCETDCIIDLRKFSSPKDAAAFIKQVATNRTLYENYHRWRSQPLRPQFEKMLNYFNKIANYTMECVLCGMSHRASQGENPKNIIKQIQNVIGHF